MIAREASKRVRLRSQPCTLSNGSRKSPDPVFSQSKCPLSHILVPSMPYYSQISYGKLYRPFASLLGVGARFNSYAILDSSVDCTCVEEVDDLESVLFMLSSLPWCSETCVRRTQSCWISAYRFPASLLTLIALSLLKRLWRRVSCVCVC